MSLYGEEAGRVYHWTTGQGEDKTMDRPATLEELETVIQSARRTHEVLTSMAEAIGGLADSFHVAAGQFSRTLAEIRPGPDAMRWKPDMSGLPVHWCGSMHRESEHPGHIWTWVPPLESMPHIRSQCPGWPLPDIVALAPDCETGDDRTCTEACPLHG